MPKLKKAEKEVATRENYPLPEFLQGKCSPEQYRDWVFGKAAAHYVRDHGRGNSEITRRGYRIAIHQAVLDSAGVDAYTGLDLDWHLISTYDNEKSRELKREYKKGLANLPTVDHVGDGLGQADFKICSWRVNDAKHDLTVDEFIAICQRVLKHQGYTVLGTLTTMAVSGTESPS